MLTLLAATVLVSQLQGYVSGPLIGANPIERYADDSYRLKEVVRFWIDRPSLITEVGAAFAGVPGTAELHLWGDIDHEWPFYRFERDLVRPLTVRVPESQLMAWQSIALGSRKIAIENPGYLYVGIVVRKGTPRLAVDKQLDHPGACRFEVYDLDDPMPETAYWVKPSGDFAVRLTLQPLPEPTPMFQDSTTALGMTGAKGGAIAWTDVDGDGWEDVLLSGSRLFRNRLGKRFEDVTKSSGLMAGGEFGVFADVDADGDQDLFVGGETDRILLNDGKGKFSRAQTDVDDGWLSRCASWLDFDRDGKVDLFVANGADGVATRNRLWRNRGDGSFELVDCPLINGTDVLPMFAMTSTAADLDLDGNAELAVLGFRQQADQLWWFSKSNAQSRAIKHGFDSGRSPSGKVSGGMGTGVGVGDLNGDARPDMWVSNLMHPDSRGYEASLPSLLYLSRRGGGFERIEAKQRGIVFDESPYDPTLGDFDNDGDLDAYIGSSYHRGDFYENVRGSFVEATYRSGIRTERGESSAACDFDHDGRLDIAVQTKDDRILLYRNVTPKRNWLQIELRGPRSIGASVFVSAGGKRYLRQVVAGKGLGSQDAGTVHFGVDAAKKVDSIEVLWSGGRRTKKGQSGINRHIAIGP